MKKSELKEMIKAAYLSEADFTNAQDDDAALGGMYDPVYEAEEEDLDEMLARLSEEEVEEGEDKVVDPYMAEDLNEQDEEEATDIEVDADVDVEKTDGGEEETANDSIVVDKKIVSLSSLPQDTRKILDTLETLRAQAEEFGDQKFITQVGNTITFFTRDFVVAGDEPTRAKVDESLEILRMKKLAGLLTEGEYAKALLRETEEVDEMATLIKKSSPLENEKSLQVNDLIMWTQLDYSNNRGMGPTGTRTLGKVVKILGPANVEAEEIKTGDLYKVSRKELTKVPSVGDEIEATLSYNYGAGSGSQGSNRVSGTIAKIDLKNMKVAIKTANSDKPLVVSLEDLKIK